MEIQELDDALDKLRDAIHNGSSTNAASAILKSLSEKNAYNAAVIHKNLTHEERAEIRKLFAAAHALCVMGDYVNG